jgi:hypothetical protein
MPLGRAWVEVCVVCFVSPFRCVCGLLGSIVESILAVGVDY